MYCNCPRFDFYQKFPFCHVASKLNSVTRLSSICETKNRQNLEKKRKRRIFSSFITLIKESKFSNNQVFYVLLTILKDVVSLKCYNQREDFDFDVVSVLCLDGVIFLNSMGFIYLS